MKSIKLGLIGRDVSKSDSERIHKFILKEKGIECNYVRYSVSKEDFDASIKSLINDTDGFNITIPYKKDVMSYLKDLKGDVKDFDSVNTVITSTLEGYNTDGIGFIQMLKTVGIEYENKKVVILGAGGAGRSSAVTLKKYGADVYMYQRRQELLKEACELTKTKPLSTTENLKCDILINCTGVGMHESEGKSPVNENVINNCNVAVDLIYRPRKSEFLKIAERLNKKILNGESMLFYQAYYSDCLYLKINADWNEAYELWKKYKLIYNN